MHDGWISNFHTSLFFGYSECSFPRGSEFVLASARFQISGSCWMEMEYKCMHTSNGSSIRNSGFLFTPHYTIKYQAKNSNTEWSKLIENYFPFNQSTMIFFILILGTYLKGENLIFRYLLTWHITNAHTDDKRHNLFK